MMRKIIFFLLFFGCLIVLGRNAPSYYSSAAVEIDKTEVKREYDNVYIKFAVKGFKKIDSVVIQIFENNAQLYKSKIELVNLGEYSCDTAFSFDKPKSNTKLKVEIQASGTYTQIVKSTEMSYSEAESLAKKIKKADGWTSDDEDAVKEVANALDDTEDLNRLRNVFYDKYKENLDLFIRKFMTEMVDDPYDFNSNWVNIVSLLTEPYNRENTTNGTISAVKEFNSESILHIAHLNYREAIVVLLLLFLLGIFLIPAISLDENKTTLNRAFRYFLLLAPFFIALAISINIYSGFTTYESNTWRIVKMLFFFICSVSAAYYVYTNLFTDQKSVR
jgi:hypothetical protein